MNKQLITFIIILWVLLLCYKSKREKFTEIRGFAGYSKPRTDVVIDDQSDIDMSKFVEQTASITRDLIQELVKPVHAKVEQDTDLCVYPVETNQVKHYVDDTGRNLYIVKFMFTTTKGFVFGLSVDAHILDGKVVGLVTQPMHTSDKIKPYTEEDFPFLAYEDIKKSNVPLW